MRKIGFGIIGSGMIANIHARAIGEIEGSSLVAVYNPDISKARAFAGRYGCTGYDRLEDFLKDPQLDAVTVATPSGLHLDGALAAIDAGKAVLVEKPIEITLERVDRMIEQARKRDVILGGVFHSRTFEVPQLIKRTIDSGRLGRIALADAYVKWYRSQEYYDSGKWRGTWNLDGGGALMNQSIHAVDLLQWFMGPVTEISGRTTTISHERIEVEDTAVATLKFANGALGVIEGTTSAWPGYMKRIEIYGSEGSIVMEEESLKVWDMRNPTKEDERIIRKYIGRDSQQNGGASDPSSLGCEGHRNEIADFADAVRNHRRPMIDGLEARKAVEIIQAIYQSARDGGRSVALPL